MLITTATLAACSSDVEQDVPPVAQAQSVTSVEKSVVTIDASASTPGSYAITSYKLSSTASNKSDNPAIEASQPLLELMLPPVAVTRTLDYTLTVTDTAGNYATTPVQIHVEAVDEAPTARQDALTAIAGSSFSSMASDNLLLNDQDEPDLELAPDALRAHLVRAPQVVQNFKLSEDGSVSFDAPVDFSENSDSFSYRVSDNSGLTSAAVEVYVRLAISGQTLIKPIARASSVIASENSSATIDASASARGSFPLVSYQLVATQVPSSWQGTLPSNNISSSPYFKLTAKALSQDTTLQFKLIVRDSEGNSGEESLQATFKAQDDQPVATADQATVTAGELLKVDDLLFSGEILRNSPVGNLLLNDRDEPQHTSPSNRLKVKLLSLPKHSQTFYVNALGGYAYRSHTNTTATTDSFTYQVLDASGASAAATVTLKIKPSASVGPTARATVAAVNEKSTATIDASQSTPGSNSIVSYRISHGNLPTGWTIPTGSMSSSRISFVTGPVDSHTVIPLTVTVSDSLGKTNAVQVNLSVSPVEEAPQATGEQYTLTRGQSLSAADLRFSGTILTSQPTNNLLLNDRDEPEHKQPSSNLRVVLLSSPAHASSFYLNALGGWGYTAIATGSATTDSFSYRVSDGSLSSNEVEVRLNLTVASLNTAPTADSQCLALSSPGNSFTGQLSALVKDSEDSSFNYTLSSTASEGSVNIDLSSGSYTYTPNSGSRGYADHFVYKVDDKRGGTATGVVNLVYGAARIMPLGDSITFGVERYTGATGDLPVVNNAVGYRKYLRNRLTSAGYMVDFVGPRNAGWDAGLSDTEHAGFPGWKAGDLAYGRGSDPAAGNIDSWLNAHPVDAVLIHGGTNDHTSNAGVLAPLLNKIQQWQVNHHPVELFIASIVDQRRDGIHNRSHLDAFNTAVEAMVPNYSNATFVNQYTALNWQTDLSSYSLDSVGLHPNTNGYQKMANRWYDAMSQSGLLNKCP